MREMDLDSRMISAFYNAKYALVLIIKSKIKTDVNFSLPVMYS